MQMTESSLVKWGNSQGVRIPKKMLELLGIKDNDKLNIVLEESSIVITPTKKRSKTLKERFEEFYQMDFEQAIANNPYTFEEVDFGGAVGDEVW